MTHPIRATAGSGRAWLLSVLAAISSCTINPVTGERELALVSAETEVSIGEAQYAPSRQMQGGDYVRDPELTRYVAGVGQRVAAVSDRDLPYEFVVLNSSVPNAWALPGGKIAINRGLLVELESEAELAAVLGHEIVHAAARHGALAMQRGMLLQGALLAAATAAQGGNYSGLAVGAASVGAQLINQGNSRGAELESDLYGMRYMSAAGYDPQAAVSLQQTFVRLSEGRSNDGWLAGLFASHPPSMERVEQNRATAASLPTGGELGRDRYQAAIAGLVAARPAYAAFDAARQALSEQRYTEAERAATEALRLLPDEAQFHGLHGDVDYAQARYDAAVVHYREAIARDDGFFYYPLRKGYAHQQLRQWDQARSDIEQSLAMLPTADAYFALGVIAEQRGDRTAALENYGLAAQSSSPAGQAAQDAAVRIDLPQNPGNYLTVRSALDRDGQLIVEVANPTRVAVADVVLVIRYAGADGVTRQSNRSFSGRLAPGSAQRAATGLGPFTSSQAFQVSIAGARVVSEST